MRYNEPYKDWELNCVRGKDPHFSGSHILRNIAYGHSRWCPLLRECADRIEELERKVSDMENELCKYQQELKNHYEKKSLW
jgi:hypothetical protein